MASLATEVIDPSSGECRWHMVGESGAGLGQERAEVGAFVRAEGITGDTGFFGWGR